VSGARVLVVEDDAIYAKLVRLLLAAAGHAAVVASTAEAALRTAREERPDLILMDVGLPGMDGFAALELLRRDPLLAGIPAIGMTADRVSADQVNRATAMGFDSYVEKPVNVGTLQQVLEPYFGSR